MTDQKQWRDPPDTLTIWVLYQNGDLPFIYAAEGRVTDDIMTDIKNQLAEECEFESTFPNGDGEYMFTATFEPAQTGEYGRIEWAAYWEFDLVSFRAIETVEQ